MEIVFSIFRSLAPSFGAYMRQKRPKSHVVLDPDAISLRCGNRVRVLRDLGPILILDTEQILEKGPNMKRIEPFLKQVLAGCAFRPL